MDGNPRNTKREDARQSATLAYGAQKYEPVNKQNSGGILARQ